MYRQNKSNKQSEINKDNYVLHTFKQKLIKQDIIFTIIDVQIMS